MTRAPRPRRRRCQSRYRSLPTSPDSDATAFSLQGNNLDQDSDQSNKGAAFNALGQEQKAIQVGGDQDLHQDVESKAETSASGGNAVAIGPNASLDFARPAGQ